MKRQPVCTGLVTMLPLNDGTHAIADTRHWRTINRTWTLSGDRAYVRATISGTTVYLHRAVWEAEYGPVPDGYEIDHVNRNPRDNRLHNLRLATRSQNALNSSKPSRRSRFRGVCFCKQTCRWSASIRYDGKKQNLGRFDTQEEAHAAWLGFVGEHDLGDWVHANPGLATEVGLLISQHGGD